MFKLAAAMVLFSLAVSSAEEIQTSWKVLPYESGSWFSESNWTAGVPNNTGDTTYAVTIDSVSATSASGVYYSFDPVVISQFALKGGRLSPGGNFTVLGQTTLADTTANAARTVINVGSLGIDSETVDLGELVLPNPGVLDRLSLNVDGAGVIQWKNALIKEIGPSVTVSLSHSNGGIRDSLSGLSALRELSAIKGQFSVLGSSLATGSDLAMDSIGKLSLNGGRFEVGKTFTNAGKILLEASGGAGSESQLVVNQSLNNFGEITNDGSKLLVKGNFSNLQGGKLLSTSWFGGITSAEVRVEGKLTNAGNIQIQGQESVSKIDVVGDFLNSGDFYAGNAFVDIGGTLENTGAFRISKYEPSPGVALHVSGNLINSAIMEIAAQETVIDGSLSNTGTLTISTFDSNHSKVSIRGEITQVSGGILSGGTIKVGSNTTYYSNPSSSILEWKNANISQVAAGASLEVRGFETKLRDIDTSANAIAGLRSNAGTIALENQNFRSLEDFNNSGSFTILGGSSPADKNDTTFDKSLTNSGTMKLGYASVAQSIENTGSLEFSVRENGAISGSLKNSGTLTVGVRSLVSVAGSFDNSGTFSIGAAMNNAAAAMKFEGPLLQQDANGTLTNGSFVVRSSGTTGTTTLSWQGASIARIAAGASITLTGAGAKIADSVSGNDALAGLSRIDGALVLNSRVLSVAGPLTNTGTLTMSSAGLSAGGTLVNSGELTYVNSNVTAAGLNNTGKWTSNSGNLTVGALANSGDLNQYSGNIITTEGVVNSGKLLHAGNSFAIGGAFANSGTVTFNGKTTTVAGDFDNTGTIQIMGAGALSIGGRMLQVDEAGVLNQGTYSIASGSTMSWAGADIKSIGRNASLSLSGTASVKDSITGLSAIRNLTSNDGRILLSGQTKQIGGDFSNSGMLNLSSGAKFSIAGTLAQNANHHLTAGSLVVTGSSSLNSVLEWNGASIKVIDRGASVSLKGAGAVIRNLLDSTDALANLTQNDGTLAISGRTTTVQHGFLNTGTLSLADGGLKIFGDGSLADSSLLSFDIYREKLSSGVLSTNFGKLTVDGGFDLSGDLKIVLNLKNAVIAPTDSFTILTAAELTGFFDNVLPGERLFTSDGSGSFVVSYGNSVDSVTLNQFVATVPEPSTTMLIVLATFGGFGLWRFRSRRKSDGILFRKAER